MHANTFIKDFVLHSDQLKEMGKEEHEETLIDLFLDAVDPI